MPERIQLSRAKGWRMPPNTVKVDRSTVFGNPFARPGDPAEAVALFRRWITGDMPHSAFRRLHNLTVTNGTGDLDALRRRLPELRGKNLGCWCKPGQPCHADVLIELANAPESEEPSCTG